MITCKNHIVYFHAQRHKGPETAGMCFCVDGGGREMCSAPHLFTASGVIRNAEGC